MAFNSSHLTFYLANLLAFYLAFCLRFYLAYLLAFYLSYLLPFYLAYLLTFYLEYLLTFYLAYLPTFRGNDSGRCAARNLSTVRASNVDEFVTVILSAYWMVYRAGHCHLFQKLDE